MSKRTLGLIAAGVVVLVACANNGRTTVATADSSAAAATTVPSSVAASAAPTPVDPATTTPAAGVAPAPAPVPAPTTAAPAAVAAPSTPVPTSPAPTSPPVTATPAPAAPPPAVLEVGVVHPWVGYSQSRLKALGYGELEVDQQFGPATKAAVVRFEQVNDTEVDGRLEASERLLLLSNGALANETPVPVAAIPQPISGPPTPPQAPAKIVVAGLATPATARSNANCQAIAAEFVAQGAELPVAEEFAYVIAPRESGCVPQEVSNATDLSYSRIGLNFIGPMPRYWGNLCGVTDYRATAELSVDVRCGLAAYRALGWKPWAV